MKSSERPLVPPPLSASGAAAALPSGSRLLSHLIESARPARHDRRQRDITAGRAVNVLLHAGVIVVGGLIAREVVTRQAPLREQALPAVMAIESDAPSPLPEPGKAFTMPVIDPADLQAGDATSALFQANPERLESEMVVGGTTAVAGGAGPSRGVGPGGAFGGDGAGARLAPFGRPDGVGSRLFPTDNEEKVAKRAVFLCDGTGTMVGLRWDLLRQELKKSINALKPTQLFNIVLFKDSEFLSMDKAKLLPATPKNAKLATEFLDKYQVRGRTNPIPGIEAAFALKPEVIFFVTDGEFDDLVSYEDVINKVATMNKGKKVRVMTILFGDRDEKAQATLEKIAADNGGVFTAVDPNSIVLEKKSGKN